jgi:hypothetical protein
MIQIGKAVLRLNTLDVWLTITNLIAEQNVKLNALRLTGLFVGDQTD